MSGEGQPGLFDLDPADLGRPVGTIEGPPRWQEGFGAGLRCWCGPLVGWRDLGEIIMGGGQASVVRHRRRLSVAITFDLGEHILPRALRAEGLAPDDMEEPEHE